jgi:hypothetical protein
LVHVSISQSLGDSLSLVVTSSNTGTVDVTPAVNHTLGGVSLSSQLPLLHTWEERGAKTSTNSLIFMLRVNLGITINLGSGRDQEPSLGPLGQSEHVHGAHKRRLDGLDGVVLVVRGRGGTGEMVDLVDLDEEGFDDVVPDHFKVGVTDPVGDLEVGTARRGGMWLSYECDRVRGVDAGRRLTVVLDPVKKLSNTVTS